MSIRVVTDSTADLPLQLADQLGIDVVPLWVTWAGQQYRDRLDLSPGELYARLPTCRELPRTSQPALGDFLAVYERLLAEGHHIISIHISSKLSGTMECARQARDLLRTKAIAVVDSLAGSLGCGFQAIEAARAVLRGASVAEVLMRVERVRASMQVLFCLDTLAYLERGGRIGKLPAMLGGLLNVKPLLMVKDGAIAALGRARGTRAGLEELLRHARELWPQSGAVTAGIIHGGAAELAQVLQRRLCEVFGLSDILIAETGPAIGTHTGPGAVGLAFYSSPGEVTP
ncbi:MAG: DegV family protein [Bacillota bacterium]